MDCSVRGPVGINTNVNLGRSSDVMSTTFDLKHLSVVGA